MSKKQWKENCPTCKKKRPVEVRYNNKEKYPLVRCKACGTTIRDAEAWDL